MVTLICSWILAFQDANRIGVYLSDISGAFDKVDTDFGLDNCQEYGEAYADAVHDDVGNNQEDISGLVEEGEKEAPFRLFVSIVKAVRPPGRGLVFSLLLFGQERQKPITGAFESIELRMLTRTKKRLIGRSDGQNLNAVQ